jgi:hypothetical protein
MSFRYPTLSVPARSLVIADLGGDRIDGQIAACVLQGIVNRTGGEKVYVVNTYCSGNRGGGPKRALTAEQFLADLYSDIPSVRIPAARSTPWPGFMSLLDRYAAVPRGLVIWDPALEEATIEAATTIAGQTDSLAVSPELAESLASRRLPVIADLRANAFGDNLACLQWLKEHWFAGANKTVAFTWSHRGCGGANRDFIVAHRLFTFHLDVHDPEQRKHYADVLNEYPRGTPVMGWADESLFDPLLRFLGYFMVPYIGVENLTVHSAFPPVSAAPHLPRALDVRGDEAFIALQVPDGDNLLHTFLYEPEIMRDETEFARIPLTWVINPAIVDLAPRLFDWYRSRIGAHQELAAQIGDGHVSSERYGGFMAYCGIIRDYMKRAGMLTLKHMAEAEAVAANVGCYVVNGGYSGCHATDERGLAPGEQHFVGETFVVGVLSVTYHGLDHIRRAVRSAPQGEPFFLCLFPGTAVDMDLAKINAVADTLEAGEKDDGRRYIFVRTMDLAATFRKWKGMPAMPRE